jgi:hypothetical protein
MAVTLQLTDAARDLLMRRVAGERVDVTEDTRPLYRELAEAGLMEPLYTFARGPEGHYRLTEAGSDAGTKFNGHASQPPSS